MALFTKFRKQSKTDKNGRRKYSYYYKTSERIGTGAFSTVKRCIRKADKKEFAVKIVNKGQLKTHELTALKEEIYIMKLMNFDHVISMLDVFDDGNKVRIVLELCDGGDLYHQISSSPNKHFDEKKSAQITCLLARTLQYLHTHYVVHRDLKPDNILFTKSGILKLSDFGIADYNPVPPKSHIMSRCCGTPAYIAPEIVKNDKYSCQVDLWSLGVVLYEMLSGTQPFNSQLKDFYGQIIRGEYNFKSSEWDNISDDAKDLVTNLMCVDEAKRFTVEEVLKHPFITKHLQCIHFNKETKELFLTQYSESYSNISVSE